MSDNEQDGVVDREARGTCGTCKHFKPDPEAGRLYDGEPNEHAGFCGAWADDETGPAPMLCGDWCERFEAKA